MRVIRGVFLAGVAACTSGCGGKLTEEQYKTKSDNIQKTKDALPHKKEYDDEVAEALSKLPAGRYYRVKVAAAELAALEYLNKHLESEKNKRESEKKE
jgi:hypothetical protein